MQKLTDLKGFKEDVLNCYGVDFFFFLRVYCFILKWQLSPLLPLECLPVHLDCHSLWPPGLSGGSRRLAALLREYRGAERQKQRWLWVGRRLKHIKAGPQREERGHCASD